MISKANTNADYRPQGRAFSKMAYSTGFVVDRDPGHVFDTTGYINTSMPASWSTTGIVVDTTGSVLFDNSVNNGSLETVLIANIGNANAYIGFNSTTPSVDNGFPLPTGASYQYDSSIVTEIWAITFAGSTVISAQGLYNDRTKR